MDARTIIYPGKNGDAWWDMAQLLVQIKDAIPIFENLHPGAIGLWVFDCSSAHKALADDALNVKNMNIKPGGKQRLLHPTVIPLNNPALKIGDWDTRGDIQLLVYPPKPCGSQPLGQAKRHSGSPEGMYISLGCLMQGCWL